MDAVAAPRHVSAPRSGTDARVQAPRSGVTLQECLVFGCPPQSSRVASRPNTRSTLATRRTHEITAPEMLWSREPRRVKDRCGSAHNVSEHAAPCFLLRDHGNRPVIIRDRDSRGRSTRSTPRTASASIRAKSSSCRGVPLRGTRTRSEGRRSVENGRRGYNVDGSWPEAALARCSRAIRVVATASTRP